ncbi:MAG: nucleotidyltransferase family protein [Caldilineaceae bacterium]|nr:nucleotidyltransferase family protein [Caldilineaceae bacterium]
MKALILAAGKGTRLRNLTRDCPKPMLTVGNRPLLDQLVCWLRRHGITEIAINLHHLPAVIPAHLGDGHDKGVAITYSHEEQLLGTAGAAKRLQSFLNEPFVVIYGDGYTNLDLSRLIKFHQHRKETKWPDMLVTVALYHVANPAECGLVTLDADGRISHFVEKPDPTEIFTDLASAGILICEPALLDRIPEQGSYDFGRDLFPVLLEQGIPIGGQPLAEDEFLIDIGTPDGYRRAQTLADSHQAGRESTTGAVSAEDH